MKGQKVLITGSNGFLGKKLRIFLEKNDFFVIATGLGKDRLLHHNHIYHKLDITSFKECAYVLNKYNPSVLINAAAFTYVDECEKNKNKCLEINTNSLDCLIPYLLKHNIHLVQISTDFVFDGMKGSYVENDICDPVNFYGFSKLKAENKIINSELSMYTILRTSLLY